MEQEHEHSHDYRVEAVVRGRSLPDDGMLLDIDVLTDALTLALAELDATDLTAHPAFAERNTTVEVVADHLWSVLSESIGHVERLASLRVTAFESPDAWAAVDRPLA